MDLFVNIFCALGVFFTLFVVLHPNILYSAVALMGVLLCVAALYGSLQEEFLAITQILIYAGAVVLMILFAIMMTGNPKKGRLFERWQQWLLPSLSLALGFYLINPHQVFFGMIPTTTYRALSVKSLGTLLLKEYNEAFLWMGFLMVFVLVGASVLARSVSEEKKSGGTKE